MIIGHFDLDLGTKGGITTYIKHVSTLQLLQGHKTYYFTRSPDLNPIFESHTPIYVKTDDELFTYSERLNLDILHLHNGINTAPPRHLSVLRTLHGHHPYCPSGSKYLGKWEKPCDRLYSPQGCLWGHLIDGCGSKRPQSIISAFRNLRDEKRSLENIPIITVSHFLRQQLIATGYNEKLIQTLYLFGPNVTEQVELPKDEVPNFIFLGRITPLKGLEWLLRAMVKVKVPVHLHIAGEGYQETEMKVLATKLDIEEKVTFHGWVTAADTQKLIQSSRAVIFPSIWHEPGGTVAFEAMAHSRAIIMSRVGGMPEVVKDNFNGLLVNPNDIEELARKIEILATDRMLAKKLGAQGHEIVINDFQIQHHVDKLMRIYEQISS